MSRDPRTPTPGKFLLPKRSTQSSQAPRFQPTPRFSSSSAPRSTEPSRGVEDVDDDDDVDLYGDGGSGSGGGGDELTDEGAVEEEENLDLGPGPKWQQPPRRRMDLGESIEIDSTASSSSLGSQGSRVGGDVTPSRNLVDEDDEEQGASSPLVIAHEQREAKRRRLSISPLPSILSQEGESHDGPEDVIKTQNRLDIDRSSAVPSVEGVSGEPEENDDDEASDIEMEAYGLVQTTFREPPRFKPLENDGEIAGLPTLFSPQRRGQKYVPGGLAAGLQGWLSEVREWEGPDKVAEPPFRFVVEDIRPGSRMELVTGRKEEGGEEHKNIVLAGEGRLVELGKRGEVVRGSVVMVRQPFWDVELEGGIWTVACDWSIE